MEERQTWQALSQARGFKLLGFTIPMFIIGFIASSQIPRTPPQKLFSQTSSEYRIKGEFKSKSKSGSRIQVFLTMDSRPKRKIKLRYKIRQKKDLLRSRKLSLKWDPNEIVVDKPINLPEPGTYTIYASLGKKSYKSLGIKSWDLHVIANPSQAHVKILRYLEILVVPSLSLILLGLVMIFVPKFIKG